MKRLITALFLAVIFCPFGVHAFDKIGADESWLGSKYVTLGFGMGYSEIVGYKGVSGGKGFGFEVTAGHEWNQSFSFDFSYKFSLAGLVSNNPLDTTQRVNSTFIFNSEALRFYYRYPAYSIQPYIYSGVGLYNFGSVDSKTGLSLPTNFQIPVGGGVLAYIYKNKLSLRASLDWHILFGENQSQTVLNLLDVTKVSFDIYSVMFTMTWHIF